MINTENGMIIFDNKFSVMPGYTFSMFKKTSYYDKQDGIKIVRLKEHLFLSSEELIVSLIFRDEILYCVSLIAIGKEYDIDNEQSRKSYHDAILKKQSVKEGIYEWGSINSNYDRLSNISSIDIIYK